jgi:hypothetical protein
VGLGVHRAGAGTRRLTKLVRSSVVAVAVVTLAALAGCGSGDDAVVGSGSRATTTSTCAHIPRDQGGCGLTFEEQRALNLRYADRVPFAGDAAAAAKLVEEVRAAVASLVSVRPSPPVEHVRQALAKWGREVQVLDNAVRTAGAAFAVPMEGGCVFGSIYEGELKLDFGGYINDGGCLAAYAH